MINSFSLLFVQPLYSGFAFIWFVMVQNKYFISAIYSRDAFELISPIYFFFYWSPSVYSHSSRSTADATLGERIKVFQHFSRETRIKFFIGIENNLFLNRHRQNYVKAIEVNQDNSNTAFKSTYGTHVTTCYY